MHAPQPQWMRQHMKISRDLLLIKILEFKHVFYALLDHIDQHEGAYEIPEALYLRLYYQEIEFKGNTDLNAPRWLSLSVLLENGIFVHHDKHRGQISLQSFLIDMLRFSDTARVRELSHTDFEQIRKQYEAVWLAIDASPGPGEVEYEEAMLSFNELMSTTHAKYKQNVDALLHQADTVAELYQSLEKHEANAMSSRDLFLKISQLHDRYVSPCMEFISPSMSLQGGGLTFIKCIDNVLAYHSERALPGVVARIGYTKTAITSYYKDIAQVMELLQRYHRCLGEDRLRYDAIEKAFNSIQAEIEHLRHGKGRGKYLRPDNPVLAQFTTFSGLGHAASRRPSLLNWQGDNSRIQFEEWLRVNAQTQTATRTTVKKPLPPQANLSKARQEAVFKQCWSHAWPTEIPDIHQYLQGWLGETLPPCTVLDVITAFSAFLGGHANRHQFQYHRQKKQLEDANHYLNYLPVSLMPRKEHEHVQ
jgi:hypothetical protein